MRHSTQYWSLRWRCDWHKLRGRRCFWGIQELTLLLIHAHLITYPVPNLLCWSGNQRSQDTPQDQQVVIAHSILHLRHCLFTHVLTHTRSKHREMFAKVQQQAKTRPAEGCCHLCNDISIAPFYKVIAIAFSSSSSSSSSSFYTWILLTDSLPYLLLLLS